MYNVRSVDLSLKRELYEMVAVPTMIYAGAETSVRMAQGKISRVLWK